MSAAVFTGAFLFVHLVYLVGKRYLHVVIRRSIFFTCWFKWLVNNAANLSLL